ncbi:MAG TPA: CHASE3 domain-containing protein [Pirellulales bacterium]|nr:CHASE3 domain-containing protein [Pirellulales bacterium]
MNERRAWSFSAATTAGLGLVVLILIGNTLVSEWNTKRLVENEHRVAQTQKVLTTLQELLASEMEALAAERGFVITDRHDYLQQYRHAVGRVDGSMASLVALAADDRWQQERVAALQKLVDLRLEDLHRVIAAQETGGIEAARQGVLTNHSSGLMDRIHALVVEMHDHERELLVERAAESQHSARLTTVTNQIGAILGIAMVALAFHLVRRDLLHRQRADDAVRQLAAIVESSDDAVISTTLDGKITSWNAGAARVYGYTATEAMGRPIVMLCPPERADEVMQHLHRVSRGERVEHFVTRRVRSDGAPIDVSLSISPVKDAVGQVIGAAAIARDVTDTKALQREVLAVAGDEQRRIGQDLHDGTGQELTGLAMLGQRLAEALAAKRSPEAELAAKIVDGLEQALGHVRALSKGLVPVEVDAEGLMAALADLVARANELHGVRCTFECRQPVRVVDNQTATHLYRMSQEALANALKHGKPTQIAVSLRADDDLVTLEIADNGRGLPEGPRATTGMGLRIMQYRAELIGASLAIKPNQPSGMRIVCALNQKQAAAEASGTNLGLALAETSPTA